MQPQALPPIIKNIIIINILMIVACIATQAMRGIDLSDYLSLHATHSSYAKPWQYITYMFMHGNAGSEALDFNGVLMHLVGNMFGLWIFGSVLERLWGPVPFLLFYLGTGIIAALCQVLAMQYSDSILLQGVNEFAQNPTWAQFNTFLSKHPTVALFTSEGEIFSQIKAAWADDPTNISYANIAKDKLAVYMYGNGNGFAGMFNGKTVGASGAVMGVVAAFAYLFPNTTLFMGFIFPIKAKYFLVLYALAEIFGAWRHVAGDNIAHIAHLGGLVAGLIGVYLYNKFNRKRFY
jgi:membrane associated rhomboid family serine protease